jgi:glucokinase
MRSLAVDIGGTKSRIAVVSSTEIVQKVVLPTNRHDAESKIFDSIERLVSQHDLREAVVGSPGRVNYSSGTVEYAENVPHGWLEWLSEGYLAERFGIHFDLANDADLAAVGEAYFGAAKRHEDVLYVTLSTGIGVGVLLDRRVVRGGRSLEIAGILTRVCSDEPKDLALSAVGSGVSLEKALKLVGFKKVERVTDLLLRPESSQIWSRFLDSVSIVLVNLTHLFSPEIIVIGGGLATIGEPLLYPIRAYVEEHGPLHEGPPIKVLQSALGDDAGLLGAAAWRNASSQLGD